MKILSGGPLKMVVTSQQMDSWMAVRQCKMNSDYKNKKIKREFFCLKNVYERLKKRKNKKPN